jgi:hypothetical protein
MKWVLLALELLMLFFANNALFFLPDDYGWFNFVAGGIGILIAAVSAWFSGKMFVKSSIRGSIDLPKVASTPPGVIWIAVVGAFCLAGLSKIGAK